MLKKKKKLPIIDSLFKEYTEAELNDILKDLSNEDKAKFLGMVQSNAISNGMLRAYPEVILAGQESAFILLYERFVKPMVDADERIKRGLTVDELSEQLITLITVRAEEGVERREKMKEYIKKRSEGKTVEDVI